MRTTETQLKELELGVQMMLSEHIVTRPDIYIERCVGMVEVAIVQKILHQELDQIEAEYPADWRESFKERWWPQWAKKRWPVRHRSIVLKASALYPMIAIPDQAKVWLQRVDTIEHLKNDSYED